MSVLVEKLTPAATTTVDDGFTELRRMARQRLMQYGFPDLKTEDWKYTPLRLLEKRELQPPPRTRTRVPALPFGACVLHFDQGYFNTNQPELPDGVALNPLQPGDIGRPEYGRREGAFGWLNLARFEQGWKLRVAGATAKPLVLAFATSEDFNAAVHPRVQIELAENASLTLVEFQDDRGAGLVNQVLDLRLAADSRLNHVLVRETCQSVWVQRTTVAVHDNARYRFHGLDLGGRLSRQDLIVGLAGPGAQAEIDGVVRLEGRAHVDYHTNVEHQVGGTRSRERFHYMAGGSGVGVFNGRIHIHPGADDSHSELNTANLLLSDQARVNTKPELEIHAEEVTASHGATVGRLDEDAIFYLRSRGLTEQEAAALLKYGFAAAPLSGIEPEELRRYVDARLKKALQPQMNAD